MRFLTALALALCLGAPAFAAPAEKAASKPAVAVHLVTVNSVDGDNVVAGEFKFSAKRFGLKNLRKTQLLVINLENGRIVCVHAQEPSPNAQIQ